MSSTVSSKIITPADEIDWIVLTFVVLAHILALTAFTCFSWSALGVGILLHWLCGSLGISLCFHRVLSHRSLRLPRWLEYLTAFLGTLAGQRGPIFWVAHHRQHHAFSDAPQDPYETSTTFWRTHLLWFIRARNNQYENYKRYAPDLAQDPVLRFLDRRMAALQLLLGVFLYLLGGWSWVIYGLFVRLVALWHVTWMINSVCHRQLEGRTSLNHNARNVWWLGLLSYGESWHANHHTFPQWAQMGWSWWQLDITYGMILILERVGWATNVHRPVKTIHSDPPRPKFRDEH